MGTLIVAVIVIIFIAAVIKAQSDFRIHQAQSREFTASHEGWDTYISPYNKGVVAINREVGRVAFGKMPTWKEYDLREIASVEILRDGDSITSTNRGSQAAGAILGGLAFGGVGLLLGGLSGSKANRSTIHSVAIKVIVDDRATPVHITEFFKSPSKKGTNAREPRIKPSLEKADHFHALLVTAIRNQQSDSTLKLSKADEIKRLWDLKQSGALTEEEFAAQKVKLLSNNNLGRGEQQPVRLRIAL